MSEHKTVTLMLSLFLKRKSIEILKAYNYSGNRQGYIASEKESLSINRAFNTNRNWFQPVL